MAHGETSGWAAGCRESCCREAIYAYNRKWNSDVAIHGDAGRRRVDATGTRRRIQALRLMGWMGEEIAAESGWKSPQAVWVLLERETVTKRTAERISVTYKRLWDRWLAGEHREEAHGGVRRRSIEQAKRKGWVPGAVWDDIDDPNERPRGLAI